jgi:hypothetical protein
MPKLLNINQAARLARVHPSTIRNWIRKRIIPDRRPLGARKIVVFASDLIRADASERA